MINLNINLQINHDSKKRLDITAKNHDSNSEKVSLNNRLIHLDYYKYKFFYNNEEIDLSKMQFKILKILFDNQNNLFTSEELEKIIRNTTKNSIKTIIAHIRAKTHKNIIKTISKKGYMFNDKNIDVELKNI